MASRPIWRGHLRLALVSCPVALYSARHDRAAIHFNLINPATGNRVRMITQDAQTEEPLARADLVKGYEFKKGHYLIVGEDDMASVKVESSDTMNVEKFVDTASIDPIYFDAGYYLVPDGRAGVDVYAVLREAIGKAGRLALARVVIAQRERTIAIRPMGHGLVAQTLHEDRDLNDAAALFDEVDGVKTDPEMVKLATMLIDRQTGRYDPADVEDRYETRLRAMLDAKIQGADFGADAAEEPAISNVVDLMAALKKSLGQGSAAANDSAPTASMPAGETPAPAKRPKRAAKVAADESRHQPGLKLPIAGGKKTPAAAADTQASAKPARPRRRA